MSSDEKITVVFILEALGRPKEHLVETLEKISKDLSEEKVVEFVRKNVHDPKETENKEIFSSFCEIEFKVEGMLELMLLVFKYMPAHIEVVTPERLSVTNTDTNELLNELAQRLHKYDEVARILQNENTILQSKVKSSEEKTESDKEEKKSKD